MKAITQSAYGTVDVLEFRDVAKPMVAKDEVLVRVRAAAVNHADLVYLTGTPLIARLAFGMGKPKDAVRGKAISGEVEAVGSAVTGFKAGDKVYAEIVSGGFAEYALVSAKLLALKPGNMTFEQSATLPLSGTTALQGIRDAGKVQPGQKVLINGASGGVGTFAVQIAKALGAEVTAVSSKRNADLVRTLGADHVVDYSIQDYTESGKQYDVIFDLIGNHSLTALRRALTREGTLVLSSGTGGRVLGPMGRIMRAMLLSPFVSQKLSLHAAKPSQEILDDLRELVEAGTVTPAIEKAYALHETADAMRHFVEKHARGKIVITV
jgi:NADPH:quinone reductase-like Zn-dependent oxidoreductase